MCERCRFGKRRFLWRVALVIFGALSIPSLLASALPQVSEIAALCLTLPIFFAGTVSVWQILKWNRAFKRSDGTGTCA